MTPTTILEAISKQQIIKTLKSDDFDIETLMQKFIKEYEYSHDLMKKFVKKVPEPVWAYVLKFMSIFKKFGINPADNLDKIHFPDLVNFIYVYSLLTKKKYIQSLPDDIKKHFNEFMSLKSLDDLINWTRTFVVSMEIPLNRIIKELMVKEWYNPIEKGPFWEIYQITNYAESRTIGADTHWCVSGSDSGEEHCSQYLRLHELYALILYPPKYEKVTEKGQQYLQKFLLTIPKKEYHDIVLQLFTDEVKKKLLDFITDFQNKVENNLGSLFNFDSLYKEIESLSDKMTLQTRAKKDAINSLVHHIMGGNLYSNFYTYDNFIQYIIQIITEDDPINEQEFFTKISNLIKTKILEETHNHTLPPIKIKNGKFYDWKQYPLTISRRIQLFIERTKFIRSKEEFEEVVKKDSIIIKFLDKLKDENRKIPFSAIFFEFANRENKPASLSEYVSFYEKANIPKELLTSFSLYQKNNNGPQRVNINDIIPTIMENIGINFSPFMIKTHKTLEKKIAEHENKLLDIADEYRKIYNNLLLEMPEKLFTDQYDTNFQIINDKLVYKKEDLHNNIDLVIEIVNPKFAASSIIHCITNLITNMSIDFIGSDNQIKKHLKNKIYEKISLIDVTKFPNTTMGMVISLIVKNIIENKQMFVIG